MSKTIPQDSGAGQAQIELVTGHVIADLVRAAYYKLDDVLQMHPAQQEGEDFFTVRRGVVASALKSLVSVLQEKASGYRQDDYAPLAQLDSDAGRRYLLRKFRGDALHHLRENEDALTAAAPKSYLEQSAPRSGFRLLTRLQQASQLGFQQAERMVTDMFDELELGQLGPDTPTAEFERMQCLAHIGDVLKTSARTHFGFLWTEQPRFMSPVVRHALAEVYLGHLAQSVELALQSAGETGPRYRTCGSILAELGIQQRAEHSELVPDTLPGRYIREFINIAHILRDSLGKHELLGLVTLHYEQHYEQRGRQAPSITEAAVAKGLLTVDQFLADFTDRLTKSRVEFDGFTPEAEHSTASPVCYLSMPLRLH